MHNAIPQFQDISQLHTGFGIAYIDTSGKILSANTAFTRLLHTQPVQPGHSIFEYVQHIRSVDVMHWQHTLTCPQAGTLEIAIPEDKSMIRLQWTALNQDHRLIIAESLPSDHTLLIQRNADKTENHESQPTLGHRQQLHQILADWETDQSENRSLAVILIGLSQFKKINETLGYDTGDQVLKLAGQRIARVSRTDDFVTALDGDKFIVLQTNQTQPASVVTLAKRLLELLQRPFLINGRQVNTNACVGMAILHQGTDEAKNLIQHAEWALAEAKKQAPGSHCIFEPGLEQRALEQHNLEVGLRRALLLQEFQLFYQPQIDMHNRKIVGCEALLRWQKSGKDWISPAQFIPLAESMGEIHTIGKWVLQTACHDAARWPANIRVAINVSPLQFEDGSLIHHIQRALHMSGLDPQRLELEITEGLLIRNIEKTLEQLWHIQNMGVTIAMDDFGTGFSSLNYLNSFPFSKIKIDQSFIRSLQTEKSRALVQAILSLGQALNMDTLAEGVETEEQLDYLAHNGCNAVQGYLISKPVPVEKILELLT